jgi:hypothetical protein
MIKVKIILGLSIWITVLPYLGFPSSFKNILFSITGLGIIYLSYVLYTDLKGEETRVKIFDNFSESFDSNESKIEPQENQEDISVN